MKSRFTWVSKGTPSTNGLTAETCLLTKLDGFGNFDGTKSTTGFVPRMRRPKGQEDDLENFMLVAKVISVVVNKIGTAKPAALHVYRSLRRVRRPLARANDGRLDWFIFG